MTDESAKNIKDKKKTFVQSEFFVTTSRQTDKINDVEQQFFVSIAKKNHFNVKTVISIDEILTSDVDDDVDYETLLIAENKKTKKLKTKRKYEIATTRNKQLQTSIKDEKLTLFLRRERDRKTLENDLDQFEFFFEFSFETKVFKLKKQRSFLALKSTNFDNYVDKNFKKY